MSRLLGAYVLWWVARRLLPLALVAGLALVFLAARGQLPAAARSLRGDVQVDVHRAQQSLARLLESGFRRRR